MIELIKTDKIKIILIALGLLLLISGLLIGGIQFLVHYGLYQEGARNVTIDRLYNVILFWAFWSICSFCYFLCGIFCQYRIRLSIISAIGIGLVHSFITCLILFEIGFI